MVPLLTKTISMALIDSVNQSSLAIVVYLLSSPKPIIRTLNFLLGVYIANFIAGYLLIFGFADFIYQFIENPTRRELLFELAIGSVSFMTGIYLSPKPTLPEPPKLKKCYSPIRAFLSGFFLTLGQLPFAIPFLYLIQTLAKEASSLAIPLYLLLFNLIVTLPLLALLFLYLFLHVKALPLIKKTEIFIDRYSPLFVKVALIVLGLILLIDSISTLSDNPVF